MNQHEAVTQINSAIFAPGWHISAQPGSQMFGGEEVVVIITLETFDTSYPDASGEYTVPKTLGGMPTIIDVEDLDSDGLACRLYDVLREIRDHEDRETLRFRQPDGSYTAPLHPHTPACERVWSLWQRVRNTRQSLFA